MKGTSEQQKADLQKAVNDYLAKDGMTQRGLANKLQVTDATVDAVKKGRWKDLSDIMVGKFMKFFQLNGEWKTRKTENFVAITNICDEARERGKMFAVSGYTGAGKTEALDWYARNKPEAYYLKVRATMKAGHFVRALQVAVGCDKGTSVDERLIAIAEHLLSRSNRPVLLIDDAGKLPKALWPLVQILYDELEDGCGIVLAGTEYLKLFFDRMVNYNVGGFRELFRRIAYWQALYPVNQEFVAAICNEYGISDANAVGYVADNVRDFGTLRNIIENALKHSLDNGGAAITREVLADLHVGDFGWRA